MAEISLRVYQNKLDDLLSKNKFNEVIAHCRHILKAYPKNLKAYSQMGQALYAATRWDESAEVFRRLLGAMPNDFMTHSYLGNIYRQLQQYDDAIWHTERAYDQQPNNSEIINRLRALYKEHRGKDIQRLQLTAGAVAQQHIRNNLYPQAIAVLDKALERYPQRVDLKVLRAQALWRTRHQVEAAETAIDVLAILPYEIASNRILTELWLMEQRPSDAQRYLSRIEDLDPYLAYRLATGEQASEYLITLDELDYEAISRHELATANPDWLNSLDNVETAPDDVAQVPEVDNGDMAWLDEVADNVDTGKKVTDDLENLLSDEWQERVDALEGESVTDDDLEDLFGELDEDMMANLDLDDDEDGGDLEDLFGELDEGDFDDELDLPEGVTTDDLPEGLLDRIAKMKGMSQDDTMPAQNRPDIEDPRHATGLTGMLRQLEDEEDLSWLTEVQQGEFDPRITDTLADDSATTSDTPDESASQSEGDSDWLQELAALEMSPDAQRTSTGLTGMFDDEEEDIADILDHMDMDDEEELDFFDEDDDLQELFEDNTPAQPINPDDPNAWLQASGIEFSEDAEPENLFDMDDEETTFESADRSPIAWLDDSAQAENLLDETDDNWQSNDDEDDDVDPMAWMQDEGIDVTSTDELATDELDGEPPPISDVPNFFDDDDDELDSTRSTEADESEWLGDDDMLDAMLSLESDEVDFDFDIEDSAEDFVADASALDDRQDTMNDDWNNDWQDEQPDDELDSMAWLNDADDDDESAGTGAAAKPDFGETASVDDEVDLEDMFAEMSEGDFADDDAGLEWLEAEELMESASEIESVIDDFEDDDEDDPMAWLNEAEIELDNAAETGESTGMTDMLNALGDENDEEEEFSFEADVDDEDAVAQEASEAGGSHWLDRIDLATSGTDDADDDEAFGDWSDDDDSLSDEADWLAEIDDDGEFEKAEPGGEADWLADDPGFSFEGDDDDEQAEMFDFEEDSASEFNFDTASASTSEDEPDWLSALDSAGDDFEEEASADDIGEPDWLSTADDFEGELESDEEDIVAGQPDWLADVTHDDDEEEEAVVANTENWLSDLGEFEAEDDEFEDDFIEDFAEDDEAEAVDQPDWLSGVAVAGAGAAAITAEELFGESADDEQEEAEAGWLADLGDFEADEDEEAIVEGDGSEWLADLGDFGEEEDDEEEQPATRSVTDELNWMDEEDDFVAETSVGATADVDYLDEVDPATAESALDWMTDVDDEDEVIFDDEIEEQPQGITDFLNGGDDDDEEEEAIAEGEGSEWLADLGEFEEDDEEEEAIVAETEPDWLSSAADFEEDDEEEAIAEGEGGDWLADLGEFEEDDEEEEAIVAETEPDWLSSATDFEEDDEEAIAEGEGSEWLADLGEFEEDDEEAIAQDNFDYEHEDTVHGIPAIDEDEESDWLEDMGVGDGVEDAFAGADDDLDWEDEDLIEEAQAVDTPDWLEGMGEGDGIQDVFAEATSEDDDFDFEDDFEEEILEGSGAGDGFDAINDYETEDEPDLDYAYEDDDLLDFEDEESFSAETQPSSGLSDEDYLAEFEEEIEHTPAEDAPDWLNAMVPGLDIDYSAEEDEPVDEGFLEEPVPTSDKGFDWLTEIVDEETGSMAPVVPRPQPLAAPRFQFSNPPAWLDRLLGGSSASASVASAVQEVDDADAIDFDDFDDDFDTRANNVDAIDDELPDWLDFDDED